MKLSLALLTIFAASGPLDPPPLVEGQRVYSIPAGYLPKEISPRALVNLEQTSTGLHNPVFVVLVKDIPNLTLGMLNAARSARYTEKDGGCDSSSDSGSSSGGCDW